MSLGINEGGVGAALCPEAVDVYLLNLQLRLEGESPCLGEHLSVFDDDGIAAIHHILGALAESA